MATTIVLALVLINARLLRLGCICTRSCECLVEHFRRL